MKETDWIGVLATLYAILATLVSLLTLRLLVMDILTEWRVSKQKPEISCNVTTTEKREPRENCNVATRRAIKENIEKNAREVKKKISDVPRVGWK